MTAFFVFIIVSFVFIHFIEVSAFFARAAGVLVERTAFGYALQNSVFMLTRVFTTVMFPMLGYVVDNNVGRDDYLLMVFFSLLLASFFGLLVLINRKRVVNVFVRVIDEYENKGKLIFRLMHAPYYFISYSKKADVGVGGVKLGMYFWGGACVFSVYAISVFIAFYFGLVFFDYRATISQLSGLSNALATVLLTFYIEPRISSVIDKNRNSASESITSLMAGRVFGTFVVGLIVFIAYLILVVI